MSHDLDLKRARLRLWEAETRHDLHSRVIEHAGRRGRRCRSTLVATSLDELIDLEMLHQRLRLCELYGVPRAWLLSSEAEHRARFGR